MTENKVAVTKKHASVTPYWKSVEAAAITTVSMYICLYLCIASLLVIADLRLGTVTLLSGSLTLVFGTERSNVKVIIVNIHRVQ